MPLGDARQRRSFEAIGEPMQQRDEYKTLGFELRVDLLGSMRPTEQRRSRRDREPARGMARPHQRNDETHHRTDERADELPAQ